MSWLPIDPASAAHALALLFGATLRISALLALAVAALWLWRVRSAASVRAGVLTGALLGALALPAARIVPVFWVAPVLGGTPAAVLMALGSVQMRGAVAPARGSLRALIAMHWPTLLLAVWLVGVVAVLVLLLLRGMIGVRRLARTATPMRDPEWLRLAAECGAVVGVRRHVRVLRGAAATTPLTWGLLRPTILVPADADAWPVAHRRAALLHELTHVRRADCLVQRLAWVACALFWFHPGVWWCARRLRLERERACDDQVLAAGTRPSVYAECLLRIADAVRRGGSGSGVPANAIAAVSATTGRPSRLHARLDAVLDDRVVRRAPSGVRRATVLGVGACVFLLVALARLSPRRDVLRDALRADAWATRAYAARILARLDAAEQCGPFRARGDGRCVRGWRAERTFTRRP